MIFSWTGRPETILEILFISFSKILLITKRRVTGRDVFSIDRSPTFLNIGPTDETFQQSRKHDFFRRMLENSVIIYESSGSLFFRFTAGIYSGASAFDKSRSIKAFLDNLKVRGILYSFRLVLKGKARKEIPGSSRLEFLEKFSASNSVLSDVEDNTLDSLIRGGIADLPQLRTLLWISRKSWEPSFWEVVTPLFY